VKTITLLNEKGGVGKTTLSQTLACGLARDGYRVLLIDADPQATATIGLGLQEEPNFYTIVQRRDPWANLVRAVEPERVAPEVKGQLWVLPGDRETRNVNVEKSTTLLQRLKEIQNTIDYVIFDTAPSASLMHILIYMATDYIIYPTLLEYYSLKGLNSSLAVLNEYTMIRQTFGLGPIQVLGIVPTMTSLKTIDHRENLIEVGNTGVPVFSPIPGSTTWSSATGTRRSIFAYDPESAAVRYANRFVAQAEAALGAQV
jgi:chromosome partitioning protein